MLNKIYSVSPVFIQNMMLSMYGYYWKNRRFSGCFKNKLEKFRVHDNYSESEWHNYQTLELRKLLIHAFTTVPFYEKLYKKNGFELSDFEKFELEDLKKLPFLEKDELRKYGTSQLLSAKKEKGKFYFSSGSSGTPTSIYLSRKFHQTWSALYEVRVRNWSGVHYKMPRAMIGGRKVLSNSKTKKPFYRYNKAESQAYFSAYHISESTATDYVKGLFDSQSKYLVGYAMSIYLLAKSILKLELKTPKLKAVLTSSEKLTYKMRETIEEAFKCKVFDAYSGVEACGLISENNKGELLFSMDSGIMEVIDSKGKYVNNGEMGEVIATGFLNYDQPLIRYRIGDQVKIAKEQNNAMLKIDEIEGRVEDVIIGRNGQQMVRFHSVFINIPYLVMSQVIQLSLEEIIVKLVVEKSFDTNNEKLIKQRITSQLGGLSIIFEYVLEIERTKNGKFKAVISNLRNE
ncbi:phenylacetate--CoA ligase family protein [Lutibacter flavus]|uniref:Phenylacetate-CoA ligase n=1 Tax=Lutibacter flavus TaxID=691689 RepID=A0A238VQJ1_9FLAO|nr:phenylacetate--CoA ligase family protein [Lutibacter flavus]SNR36451.1 phenylacetate-CoA ligase [Lutibacter flavus]